MINKIREISLKKAGLGGCLVGGVNILVHILVIIEVMPYIWINGGMTESLVAARQTSIVSILMTLVNILIVLVASQIIPLKLNRKCAIALSVFLIATLPLSFIGIIQQFLGTMFEKCVMGFVTTIGFCLDTRIAFEKRW